MRFFKKYIWFIFLIIVILLLLLGYKLKGNSEEEYRVTFDTDGGSVISSLIVKKNEKITQPEDPVKEGYIFDGWYYNDELFDFNTKITKDIVLKAKWIQEDQILRLDLQELSLKPGETHTLNVENTTNQQLLWTSSDENIATVDENGTIKALKSGNVTITVMTKDKTLKDNCNVIVTDDLINVQSVSIQGTNTVTVGFTIKLTAYIKPTNASNKAVSWQSSNEQIASVDKFGRVKGIKAGKVKITVTTEDGKKTAQKTITVTKVVKQTPTVSTNTNINTNTNTVTDNKNSLKEETKEESKPSKDQTVFVTGVKINGESSTYVGETLQLTAIIKPSNATNQNVKWTSSDENIAIVNEKGQVKGINPGKVTITVTTEDGKYRDQKTIEVTDAYQIVFTKQYNNYKVLTGYKLAVYKNKQALNDFTALIYRGNTRKFTSRFAAVGEIDENEKTASLKIEDEVIDNIAVSYQ